MQVSCKWLLLSLTSRFLCRKAFGIKPGGVLQVQLHHQKPDKPTHYVIATLVELKNHLIQVKVDGGNKAVLLHLEKERLGDLKCAGLEQLPGEIGILEEIRSS